MDRWTAREEAELQRLVNRKNELNAKNMVPLLALAKTLVEEPSPERLAEAMACSADQLRDALEPFDSGCRQATDRAA